LGKPSEQVKKWHDTGEKIVFSNGCFDLIHRGHIDYLAKAADMGSKLFRLKYRCIC
jgi:bifunctional ADP-heptose synthase (sugar kinase/adenylyltransferase)